MRTALLAVLLVAAAPAVAETAPTPTSTTVNARSGQMLRDAAKLRIGMIDAVKADGSVGVIVGGRYVVIPASTLSMTDGKLTTSLTKKAVLGAN